MKVDYLNRNLTTLISAGAVTQKFKRLVLSRQNVPVQLSTLHFRSSWSPGSLKPLELQLLTWEVWQGVKLTDKGHKDRVTVP